MRRVLQLTGLVGGILLFLLTALIQFQRSDDPVQTLITRGNAIQPDGSWLETNILYIPSINVRRPITSTRGEGLFMNLSVDGQWVYLFVPVPNAPLSDYTLGSLFRMGLTGGRGEQITPLTYLSKIIWSPDKNWILYTAINAQGETDLYRIRADGQGRLNLTENFALSPLLGLYMPVSRQQQVAFSSDGQSVVFMASDTSGDSSIFRVRLSGGQPEKLTDAFPGDVKIEYWSEGEDWFAFRWGSQLSLMTMDGQEFNRLSPNAADEPLVIVKWLPHSQMLVASTQYYFSDATQSVYYGVHLKNPTPLWEMRGQTFAIAQQPMTDWLIILPSFGPIELMRLDGTERTAILTLPENFYYVDLSPDNQWLFIVYARADQNLDLYRVSLLDGHFEFIAILEEGRNANTGYHQWSLDKDWLLYILGDYDKTVFHMIRADGQDYQAYETLAYERLLVWGPTLNKHWSVPLLFFISIGLLSSARLLRRGG